MRWVVIGTYRDDYKTKAAREEAIVIKQNMGKGLPPVSHRVKPETALARLQDSAEKWFIELDELVLSKNLSKKPAPKKGRPIEAIGDPGLIEGPIPSLGPVPPSLAEPQWEIEKMPRPIGRLSRKSAG